MTTMDQTSQDRFAAKLRWTGRLAEASDQNGNANRERVKRDWVEGERERAERLANHGLEAA